MHAHTDSDEDSIDIQSTDVQALSHLRKESLDLYNRLHSISEDTEFVREVCATYSHLPVLPNLRCGAWYVDPVMARDEPAYFNSTDGHFNNWSFNLRRPNLHLLSIVASEGGLILVDSTRAGKRIPDALSKTVPIWCTVINRAIQRRYPSQEKADWDSGLYCPPGAVSAQEQAQIEKRLDGWVDALLASAYILADLSRPLRPFWITPSTSGFPLFPKQDASFHPIVCVSASKQVQEGWARRPKGFAYVQGSGDDHELWGQGLTPTSFWDHKDTILNTDRAKLHELVRSLVVMSRNPSQEVEWITKPTSISRTGGLLLLGAVSDLPSPLPRSLPDRSDRTAFVLLAESTSIHEVQAVEKELVFPLQISHGKKDQLHFLQSILPHATVFVGKQLSKGLPVCICCENGEDISVGVALAALQLFFDDDGRLLSTLDAQNLLRCTANKQSIAKRLQWIISSRPQANPSRATLKRVNEYLMTSPNFRRNRGTD